MINFLTQVFAKKGKGYLSQGGDMGTPGPPFPASYDSAIFREMNTFSTLLMDEGCFKWVSSAKH